MSNEVKKKFVENYFFFWKWKLVLIGCVKRVKKHRDTEKNGKSKKKEKHEL